MDGRRFKLEIVRPGLNEWKTVPVKPTDVILAASNDQNTRVGPGGRLILACHFFFMMKVKGNQRVIMDL
jgi:hypothetical protein